MAGKLFPETYIGDSEDVCKKTPPGKKHLVPQRDIRSASPPSLENKSQEDNPNLADSEELKELPSEGEGGHRGDVEFAREETAGPAPESHPKEEVEEYQKHLKGPSTNVFDFNRGKEKNEGSHHYAGQAPGEMGIQETLAKNPASAAQEGLWPPPGDNTKEHLEPRVNEVSLIDSFELDRKQTASPGVVSSGRSLNSPLDHEDSDLCDEEAHLKESSASTGYFPCYRTYVELPRYQSPAAEGHPGTCRDASVQCDGFSLEAVREKRGAEANNNSKETKAALQDASSPWGQPHGGSRPGSRERRLEGSGRHSRLHRDSGQEAGGKPKESTTPPKPRTPGKSPSRSGIKLGTAEVASRSGQWPSPPLQRLATSEGRKSPQKRKHRSSPTDDKDSARSMELKPLLHDQHSLPSNLEEKAGPLPACCFSTEAAGESRQVRPTKEREREPCQRAPSVQSGPSPTESPASPPEPHTNPSRLSFHSLVSWVWRIFRKPTQPQPSTSTGTTTSRRPLGSRLRLWLAQHSNRVYPEPY